MYDCYSCSDTFKCVSVKEIEKLRKILRNISDVVKCKFFYSIFKYFVIKEISRRQKSERQKNRNMESKIKEMRLKCIFENYALLTKKI